VGGGNLGLVMPQKCHSAMTVHQHVMRVPDDPDLELWIYQAGAGERVRSTVLTTHHPAPESITPCKQAGLIVGRTDDTTSQVATAV
jgi:hypothetical protein